MGTRRGFLVAGVLGMCAVAPSRVRGATEVEGAGYIGDSPGGYACGPMMRARYAGAAARVRIAENDSRFLDQGYSVEAAGSIARERYEVLDCDDCTIGTNTRPGPNPDAWMGGSHVRGAYSVENVGIALGVSSYTTYSDETSTRPGLRVFPDLEIGGGVAGKYRILGGFGTPTLGSLRHPGLYAGGDFCVGATELQGRLGFHRAGPGGDVGGRVELAGYFPLVEKLDLRLSGAALAADNYGGGEASLGLRAGF